MNSPAKPVGWLGRPAEARWPSGDETDPNPFVRFRHLLWSHRHAIETGMDDRGFVDLVHRLDDSVASVDGGGFRHTPLLHLGDLGTAIKARFDTFQGFKDRFSEAGATRFGSGWSWLVVKGNGSLDVYSTANQDSPVMRGLTPILGVDVWEHAYYLNYQNRRPDYLAAFWNVVNWDIVGARYDAAQS